MRYSRIDDIEYCNGEGVGVSLFVQGCEARCYNCFNPETWIFENGEFFGLMAEEYLIKMLDPPYVKRLSILGGEPLHPQNRKAVANLVTRVRYEFGNEKKIWIYTGYTAEELDEEVSNDLALSCLFNSIDVLVDGRYEDEKRDYTLQYRGSSNQRVIDMNKTRERGEIVLWSPSISKNLR